MHEDPHHTFNFSSQHHHPQHPASSIFSTSTPELNRINLTYHHQHPVYAQQQMPTQDQIVAELQRLNLYKPPPPYPGTNANGQHLHMGNGHENRIISSTSTPDLASSNIMATMNANQSGVMLGGSSPDLVSRKNLGKLASKDTTLHRTMDNLHNLMEQQQLQQYPPEDDSTLEQGGTVGGFSQQVSNVRSGFSHEEWDHSACLNLFSNKTI